MVLVDHDKVPTGADLGLIYIRGPESITDSVMHEARVSKVKAAMET